jgi:hypothetical protein
MSDWTDEETDDPLYADRCNFFKVELLEAAAEELQQDQAEAVRLVTTKSSALLVGPELTSCSRSRL